MNIDEYFKQDANKTYYYEADGRLVKEVNDENGAPTGAYTYMPDTDEWRLGTPSSYFRERVKITEARCEAWVDAARMNR